MLIGFFNETAERVSLLGEPSRVLVGILCLIRRGLKDKRPGVLVSNDVTVRGFKPRRQVPIFLNTTFQFFFT